MDVAIAMSPDSVKWMTVTAMLVLGVGGFVLCVRGARAPDTENRRLAASIGPGLLTGAAITFGSLALQFYVGELDSRAAEKEARSADRRAFQTVVPTSDNLSGLDPSALVGYSQEQGAAPHVPRRQDDFGAFTFTGVRLDHA